MYVRDEVLQSGGVSEGREEGCVEVLVRTVFPVTHHQHCHHATEGQAGGQEPQQLRHKSGNCFRRGGGGVVRGRVKGHSRCKKS